jgi:hypothetical protein
MARARMSKGTPTYIDRPEVSEVFADRLQSMYFDGASIRMEFCVVRLADASMGEERRAWAYPSCRVVLSARGAAEMLKQMSDLQAALAQQGLLPPAHADMPAATEPV